jgi:1-acyl-sn-glycerol-3-phosphate acyltransferase
MVGLLRASIVPAFRRWGQTLAALLYAVRFQVCYRSMAPVVFLGVILLPGLARRRRFFRAAGRLMLRLAGIAPRVEGLRALPDKGPVMVLANHASYLDGLVLSAVLPLDFAFVAKRELVEGTISGSFLKGLGTVFVERIDPAGGIETAREIAAALEAGETLVMFPEGTFDRRPGLRAFHVGAFVAACQAGVAMVPVGLAGTRGILRGDSGFARPGRIVVAVGPTIAPQGDDWQAALRVRDAAREAILALCREPDLLGEPTAI